MMQPQPQPQPKAPAPLDYLVQILPIAAGAPLCHACRTRASSVRLLVLRVEMGLLWNDHNHEYCAGCIAGATERAHGECHRRMYGTFPPKPKPQQQQQEGAA